MARAFAVKLNQAQGPVTFLVPTRGWCSFDREGGSVYAPEEDRLFTQELRAQLKPGVNLREVEANLEDGAFGEAVEEAFLDLLSPANAGLEE